MIPPQKTEIPRVLTDEETPPSRPGWTFVAIFLFACAGVGYLVFWPHGS